MKHTLLNGRVIEISDNALRNLMDACGCSIEEAVNIWLTDHDFIVNEEQENLDKIAKKVHISRDIDVKKTKKERKKPEKKVSSEKQQIFQYLKDNLSTFCEKNNGELTILNENKLFSLKIGEKIFKLDLIETKNKKNP